MWHQNTTRKLDTSVRTERDLGGSVEIPQHRLFGDRAESELFSSPWVDKTTDVVDVDCTHFPTNIEWRDIDENRLADETFVELNVRKTEKIEPIESEHLKAFVITGIEDHGVGLWPCTSTGEDTIGFQGVPVFGLGLEVGKDRLPWRFVQRFLR
jgi:hypothetical protein